MTSEEIAIELTNHNDRMEVVEKGVSNFRDFQAKVTRKIGFVYGATWALGIVGSLVVLIFGYMLTLIVPAAKVIVDDYYRNHPAAQIHSQMENNHPVTASNGSPMRAVISAP